ncbi:MAG: hypothetical protein LC776_16000 [Acidobacteria bacterium]|nr:hypothetical protein [Acidobacteriota bacterium]
MATGDYCQTLDMTDVATTGTETMAVENKAQFWVFEAFEKPEAKPAFSPAQTLAGPRAQVFTRGRSNTRRPSAKQ